MIIVALDYGERYVGVAVTDEEGKTALRHGVIDQTKEAKVAGVARVVREVDADLVLVGVPVGLDGEETEQTHRSLKFLEQLHDALGPEVEVESVDETYTTVQAERRVRDEGGKAEEAHAEAARIMLADYIKSKMQK